MEILSDIWGYISSCVRCTCCSALIACVVYLNTRNVDFAHGSFLAVQVFYFGMWGMVEDIKKSGKVGV